VSTESKMRDDFEVWAADWGAMGAHHKAVAWDAYQAGRAAKAQEVTDDDVSAAVRAWVQAGKRGVTSLEEAMRCALAAVRGGEHE